MEKYIQWCGQTSVGADATHLWRHEGTTTAIGSRTSQAPSQGSAKPTPRGSTTTGPHDELGCRQPLIKNPKPQGLPPMHNLPPSGFLLGQWPRSPFSDVKAPMRKPLRPEERPMATPEIPIAFAHWWGSMQRVFKKGEEAPRYIYI